MTTLGFVLPSPGIDIFLKRDDIANPGKSLQ